MKKSTFNKSVTRIVMSLGTVGVLAMAPMHNALASSSMVVTGKTAAELTTKFAVAATNFCAQRGKKLDFTSFNPRYTKAIKLKPGSYKAKIKFECVR